MPETWRKQIYVNEADREAIWEPAQKKWGGSLSSLITRLLKEYLQAGDRDTTEEELRTLLKDYLHSKGNGHNE